MNLTELETSHPHTTTNQARGRISRRLGRADHGPFPESTPAPWLEDVRGECPDPNALWNGIEWRVPDGAAEIATLERVRPCPGVAPRAARRHDKGRAVSWKLLDLQLEGIEQRRGRGGVGWIWSPERSARATMANVLEQTARAVDVTRGDLREPTWLRDDRWALSATERILVVAVLCAYESGWGGLFDCQSTLASDLGIGCERTIRNLLHGTKWKTAAGELRHRPGLIERGFIAAIQTWKPGRPDARPSDHGWILLRPGPAIERVAAWWYLAKDWSVRAPRHSGWTRRAARRIGAGIRSRAGRHRFAAAGLAWERRSTRPSPDRQSRDGASIPTEGPIAPIAPIDTQPGSLRSPPAVDVAGPSPDLPRSQRTQTRSPSEQSSSDLVDLADVAAALEHVRSSQRHAGATAEQLAAARAECEQLRALESAPESGRDGGRPCVSAGSRGGAPSQPRSPKPGVPEKGKSERSPSPTNCPASVADNPAHPGPLSGTPGFGLRGWEGAPPLDPAETQGRPPSRPDSPQLAAAGTASAVRPNDGDARQLAPADGRTASRVPARGLTPAGSSTARPRRVLEQRRPPGRRGEHEREDTPEQLEHRDTLARLEQLEHDAAAGDGRAVRRAREVAAANPELATALEQLAAAWTAAGKRKH